MNDIENLRVQALAQHLDIDVDAVEATNNNYTILEAGSGVYRVLTDSEADDAWEECLDSCIDECVLPEIPAHMQGYFNRELWKRDARYDGRGHALSSYDVNEEEVKVDDVTFYIFRVN